MADLKDLRKQDAALSAQITTLNAERRAVRAEIAVQPKRVPFTKPCKHATAEISICAKCFKKRGQVADRYRSLKGNGASPITTAPTPVIGNALRGWSLQAGAGDGANGAKILGRGGLIAAPSEVSDGSRASPLRGWGSV